MLRALAVIFAYDETIHPPAKKWVICVEPALGYYFRINSRGHWPDSVPIDRASHRFLRHDSFVECGEILELDEYVVAEQAYETTEIHEVSATTAGLIYQKVQASALLPGDAKAAILNALEHLVGPSFPTSSAG